MVEERGLDERRDEILRALVEEHIRTGEPVASRAILETTGLHLSGATIRNELAALDREGYAVQPHTSAGRVPTAKAYRYYVDHLTPVRPRGATQQRINRFFSSVHLELGRLLKATTDLLSEITHYPAVAVTQGPSLERVKAVHLVQLAPSAFLVVAVTETGRVCQELCRVAEQVTASDLEDAERVLAAALVGHELGRRPGTVDGGFSPAVRDVLAEAEHALAQAARPTSDVYVGGTRQMATVWGNLTTVHRVLEVLEREAMLLDILARAHGTTIQIGGELLEEDVDMAVVSASFEAGGAEGRVGVIGPMRMDYRKVISAVEGVSRELGDRLPS
jgi:heat-inducible transcriptional repressor